MIGLSVGGTGAFTLFTPLAARIHVGLLIALRVAVGLAEVNTGVLEAGKRSDRRREKIAHVK